MDDKMIAEFSEADDSRVRWEKNGEWKSADIDDLIAAYERQKNGKWLNGNYKQICSECLYRGYRSWKFCPRCGAQMERGEE